MKLVAPGQPGLCYIASAGTMTRLIKPTFFTSAAALLISLTFSAPLVAEDNCYQSFSDADYSAARSQCQEQAELGDAKAAFLLANIYYQGLDVVKDEQRALFWDQVAAKKGHPDSAYRLALAYQLGQGVSQNYSKARSWYLQAALAKHPKAQKQLGAMFETGSAGEIDKQKAFEWYLRAAKQGLADAQFRAGTMLLEGDGVTADSAHAQHWIRKAAISGNARAQVALGVLLLEIDPQESISWYVQAAEQGNGLALENLAWVYYSGQGVEQSDEQAVVFAERAIAAGNEGAKALLNRLLIDKQQQRIAQLKTEKKQLHEQMIKVLPQPAAGIETEQQNSSSLAAVAPLSHAAEQPAAVALKLPDQNTPKATSEEIFATTSEGMLPDGWVLSQPSQSYTIQLTYGMEESGIKKFISKHRLDEQVNYYRTRRNAGIFYILVYGQYGSVAEARKALKGLPDQAQKDHWIRNISQLQSLYRAP